MTTPEPSPQTRFTDKPSLSRKPRKRGLRETPDVAGAARRLIVATGERIAQDDPPALRHLLVLEEAFRIAQEIAVDGLRVNFTDSEIGAALGISKQAVQQRWPRPRGGRP